MKRSNLVSVTSLSLLYMLCHLSFHSVAQAPYDKVRLTGFYQRQEYDEAIRYLQSFQNGDESASYCSDLGYSFYMNEQYEQAKMYFQKGLLLQPGNFECTLYLAQLYSICNNPDSALAYYINLTLINPRNYRFWQKAGNIYYQTGNFDSAFNNFRRAYSLNNNAGRVAISLANIFIHNKKTDAADSLLQEFMARDSSDEDVISKRIEICFKKSLYDTVIAWGEKLWRDSSQLASPFVNLAFSYLNKQLYPKCIRLCQWLEVNNKANESVLYCEALAYSKMKLFTESNGKLDECIKLTIQENAHTYLSAKADNFEEMTSYKKAAACYDTAWYIFHKPYDLYFAGRLYDKYFKNTTKAKYYYRLFQQNKPVPKSSGESRVITYVQGYLENKLKPVGDR